ncbi:MAG: myxococcus cysteine-rich repeat containing protein, partial [Nanoarchaeota archaeon]
MIKNKKLESKKIRKIMNVNSKSFIKLNYLILIGFLLMIILCSSYLLAAGYYSESNIFTSEGTTIYSTGFDRSKCEAGQDFVLQIDPTGCIPSVVRSDLLEEENVPVFCPVIATQLNPLIDIEAINQISFSGQYPKEISGSGYYPARAALGRSGLKIVTPIANTIGYAVIVLKKNTNEASMPDFVEGNLTAKIKYDIKNAFGVGQSIYYLPQLSESDWNNNYKAYSFWDGRGYLRVNSVLDDSASITIYSDRETYSSAKSGEKREITTVNLEKGETSREIYMPGFDYCLGGMQLKLNGIENPDTTSRLNINGDYQEFIEGEKFLNDKCTIKDIVKQGIVEKTTIRCAEDEKTTEFPLITSPKIKIAISGEGESATEKDYSIGDRLYIHKTTDETRTVWLAYIFSKDGSKNEESLVAKIIETPGVSDKDKLSAEELNAFANYYNDIGGETLIGIIGSIAENSFNALKKIFVGLVYGKFDRELPYGETQDIFGKSVKLTGYADSVDADFSNTNYYPSDFKEYYEKAMEDYDSILSSFSGEKYPETEIRTLGNQALRAKIELASRANQKRTVIDLCKEFIEQYSIEEAPSICTNPSQLASSEINFMEVVIGGKVYSISPDGIREPTFEDYGAKILVNIPGKGVIPANLRKNQIFTIDSSTGEYIQLVEIPNTNSVRLNVIHLKASGIAAGIEQFLDTGVQSLTKGIPEGFKSDYTFTLEEVHLKKVAKVSVIPNIHYSETKSTFSFRIGIEKRAIQLSPEKTKERIDSLEKTIKQWNNINSKLGNVVSGLKAACLVTGTTLIIKNFVANVGGQGLARAKVMRGSGGWYEICKKEAAAGKYGGSVDKCLLENSDKIETAIDEYSKQMNIQNEQIKKIQKGVTETSFFKEDVVDTAKAKELYINDAYKNELQEDLNTAKITSITSSGEDVPISKVMKGIDTKSMSLTEARDLQLNARLLSSTDATVREIASKEIKSILEDVYLNSKAEVAKQTFLSGLPNGFNNLGYSVLSGPNTQTAYYSGGTMTIANGKVPAQGILYKQTEYVVQLEKVGTEDYRIIEIYDKSGNKITEKGPGTDYEKIINGFVFKYYDRTTFENPYTQPYPKLKYYETGNYKGVPALVPFDSKNGWYVAIEPVIPIGGSVKSVSDSGIVTSYYLCNVGVNGQAEFNSGIADDKCMGINRATGKLDNVYPGLSESEAASLINKANSAIAEASRKYPLKAGDKIDLFGEKFEIGEPATGTPAISCQDFMSAVECNILFNICDPVICPSSRCNLGGNYPVSNVIQSGIIGSLALCLPNFPEIKVPICLTGVHAGLENYITVLDSYKQCLQTSLDTGETVGICDELNSIYMCDFFWRQTLPIVQYAAPKIIGSVLGTSSARGGGEYLGFNDAWQKVGDSVDYFTQYYAENSFAAFKARSLESVGTEICKNWVSLTAPNSGNVFDALVSPDSPPQFYGNFDEIPYTTATTTPMSQYKVFYHIYSGKDLPTYYQVYLKGTVSSYYQDASYRKIVATGFIEAGKYSTATEDFLAPSGYNQMCIVVNNQEECGFKQISTDFAVNYLKDQYVASQANQTDITTQTDCISGTVSLYSILNTNLQAGAEDVINPAIYNSGITRVCSTDNPGIGTDTLVETAKSRWQEVGYCGNTKIKCWIDTQSVRDAIKMTNIENEILGEVSDNYLEILQKEGGYITDFNGLVKQIDAEPNYLKKIEIINTNFAKVFFNSEKGYLYLLRANAFKSLANDIYKKSKICGNGVINNGETCDDGNKISGDGCSNTCLIEGKITGSENIETFASTYGSPVFKFKYGGGLGLFKSSIYYRYIKDKWYWSLTGDITKSEDWKQASLSPQISNDAVKILTLELSKKTFYTEGLKILMDAKDNDEGLSGFLSDTELITNNVKYSDSAKGRFTYSEVTGISRFFEFDISSQKWKWSGGTQQWFDVPKIPSQYERIEVEVLEAVKALEGKNLYEGAAIIFDIEYNAGSSTAVTPSDITSTNLLPIEIRMVLGGGFLGDIGNTDFYYIWDGKQWKAETRDIFGAKEVASNPIPTAWQDGLNYIKEQVAKQNSEGDFIRLRMSCSTKDVSILESTGLSSVNVADFISQKSRDICGYTFSGIITPTTLTCSTTTECQKVLGQKIIEIAKEIQNEKSVDISEIKTQTGVANFECLVLLVANKESSLKHCKEYQQNNNPLYCNGNLNEVKKSTVPGEPSYGIMQINTDWHKDVNVANFEENVRKGVNLLLDNYRSASQLYSCYKQADGKFVNVRYSGWQRSLRAYNGWNSPPCTNTRNYVDDVLSDSNKNVVLNLFPEC